MKILWLINIPLPEASVLMGEKPQPFGGWLDSASSALSYLKYIELSIIFPKAGLNEVKKIRGDRITFYAFPSIDNTDVEKIKGNQHLVNIMNKIEPDIVHIFGTEFSHSLSMANICKKDSIKLVISIQGLVSVIGKHYLSCLPNKIQSRYTFRDFLKRDNLESQQKKFERRGEIEIQTIQLTNHVIGRTTWDKACCTQINKDINYHYCNEILRSEFYGNNWEIDKCEKYSIFVSQGSYPIKGLHFMLQAMPLILKQYPSAKLYIGGTNIVKSFSLKEKLKISSYGKYIKELIEKLSLQNKVIFTGILDERQMCERYLKSNVFVCPSTIENSPNSLGEAMILGVPCVSSNVGGISDLLKHQEEGFLYQFDASYMLAYYVNEIFSNDQLALKFSKNARDRAQKTHDKETNTLDLVKIYQLLYANEC